jgi:DNA modification methylase
MRSKQPYWSNGIVTMLNGDVKEVLTSMEADSVDCVVTSPPYW